MHIKQCEFFKSTYTKRYTLNTLKRLSMGAAASIKEDKRDQIDQYIDNIFIYYYTIYQ